MGKEKTSEKKVVLTKIDSSQLMFILPSPDLEGVISVEEALYIMPIGKYINKPEF
jgi:hypothetical protein